jgi:hypothetical protein
MKMVQILEGTKDFEFFWGATLAPSGWAPKIQNPKWFWADAPLSDPQLPSLG